MGAYIAEIWYSGCFISTRRRPKYAYGIRNIVVVYRVIKTYYFLGTVYQKCQTFGRNLNIKGWVVIGDDGSVYGSFVMNINFLSVTSSLSSKYPNTIQLDS